MWNEKWNPTNSNPSYYYPLESLPVHPMQPSDGFRALKPKLNFKKTPLSIKPNKAIVLQSLESKVLLLEAENKELARSMEKVNRAREAMLDYMADLKRKLAILELKLIECINKTT